MAASACNLESRESPTYLAVDSRPDRIGGSLVVECLAVTNPASATAPGTASLSVDMPAGGAFTWAVRLKGGKPFEALVGMMKVGLDPNERWIDRPGQKLFWHALFSYYCPYLGVPDATSTHSIHLNQGAAAFTEIRFRYDTSPMCGCILYASLDGGMSCFVVATGLPADLVPAVQLCVPGTTVEFVLNVEFPPVPVTPPMTFITSLAVHAKTAFRDGVCVIKRDSRGNGVWETYMSSLQLASSMRLAGGAQYYWAIKGMEEVWGKHRVLGIARFDYLLNQTMAGKHWSNYFVDQCAGVYVASASVQRFGHHITGNYTSLVAAPRKGLFLFHFDTREPALSILTMKFITASNEIEAITWSYIPCNEGDWRPAVQLYHRFDEVAIAPITAEEFGVSTVEEFQALVPVTDEGTVA